MWRAIPLAKMVMRMAAFGALIGIVEGLALHAISPKGAQPLGLLRLYVIDRTLEGLFLGLISGAVMALFTLLFYRRINKPQLYQFAMVILSTIVALVLIQPQLNGFNTAREFYPFFRKLLMISIAKLTAMVMFSGTVAGKYSTETSLSEQKGRA